MIKGKKKKENMKKNKENCDKEVKIEKKYILNMLKENDCETLEELRNLIIFLNNENKRLHSIDVESLKKINILNVRVKNLEKITKNYNEKLNQKKINCKKKYKRKLNYLKNQINILTNYTKDKENEYNRLIEEQDKYFKNFFINLNKNMGLIISCDSDTNYSSSEGISSYPGSIKIKNEETHSDSKLKNNILSSSLSSICFHNKNIKEKNNQCLKKENNDDINNDKLLKKIDNYIKSDISDDLYKIKLQKNISSKIDHPSLSKEIKINGEDKYKDVEKIKSTNESMKNADNELLHSKNIDLNNEKEFHLYSKNIEKLNDSPYNSLCIELEKKNSVKVEKENEQNFNLNENQISKDKLCYDNALSKTIEGSKLEAQKTLNKIMDYNIDIKNRLNNLLEDMYIEDNKKKDKLGNNNFNKISSNNNIMNILNNKLNITCLDDINTNKLKYVKYNTIHREIINPRQNIFNQSKKSIDHIICL